MLCREAWVIKADQLLPVSNKHPFHLLLFILASALLALISCSRLPEKPWVDVVATPIERKTIDHGGRMVELHDVHLSVQNLLKTDPVFVSTVDINYQSAYLKSRNPEKFSYTLEKLKGGKWMDTNGGYGGSSLKAKKIEAGSKVEFTVPIPLGVTGGGGTYRIRLHPSLSEKKKGAETPVYSNEFEI